MNEAPAPLSTAAIGLRFAAFVLVCLLATGWLVVTIGNVQLFASQVTYEAVVEDVTGLLVDDAVHVAGVPVGKVTRIELERGVAVVSLAVDDALELGHDTTVEIRWRNTLGLRNVQLRPAGDGRLPPGHRFPAAATRAPADIDALTARLEPLMRAIDPDLANTLIRELGAVIGGRERQVQALVADAGRVLEVVAERDRAIERTLVDGATLAEAYADRRATLERLLRDAGDLGEALGQRTDVLLDAAVTLTDAQAELDRMLTTNDGTIRELLRDVDRITALVGRQHGDLERLLETTGTAIVSYHRVSRWGEWFNIRIPSLSSGEVPIMTERGASLPPRGTVIDRHGHPVEEGSDDGSRTAAGTSSASPSQSPDEADAPAGRRSGPLAPWFDVDGEAG